jgi:rhodanese-related sulfurtransferase/DNA-directed RNA polymerase subunit RPC12/RpoP
MKTPKTVLKITTLICIVLLAIQSSSFTHESKNAGTTAEEYVCMPCGNDCDNKVYNEPGTCPDCNMPLVKKSTVNIKNIQPSEICGYIAKHPGVVLLDVRTKEEFEGTANPDFGTLQNAINIPLKELSSRLSSINNLKEKEIIVYCSHSHRSPQATYLLMQNGFTNVTNMAGGMSVMKDNACKKPVSALKDHQLSPPFSSVAERLLDGIEKNIIDAAEAMPGDKFDFTPDGLNVKGSVFNGVRTFAGQVKHLATDNFAIWSPITGDPLPAGIKNVNGPENLKSKAEIIQFLKESFAQGHKAIATLTAGNAMDMLLFRGSNLPRLDLAFYALTHANEHYGQMVVYLRMCGIIPPASMPR